MNRSRSMRGVTLAAILTVISISAPAFGIESIPQMPHPGQSGPVSSPHFDYVEFGPHLIDGVTAGRVLRNATKDNDTAEFRGAADAEIYRRISPAVVMVITKDGLGSGSLISPDGLILTCNHVVSGYSQVGVLFKPNREGALPDPNSVVLADVVKTDQVADLALLKLEVPPKGAFTPVKLGAFDGVKVGDDVHAIGHPTGEAWTYTKGIVSQIRRGYEWQADDRMKHIADVVQTQTPINPGNSGGPLISSDGGLIGVNAFKDSGEGLNFAIGSDEIARFMHRDGNRIAQVATPAAAECEAHVLFEGRNAKDDSSIKQIDTECHGKPDLTYVLPDDPTKPLFVIVSISEKDNPDGVIFSDHRDGVWNISYWDSTGSGTFDTIGYHPDGKLKPSSYGPFVNQ